MAQAMRKRSFNDAGGERKQKYVRTDQPLLKTIVPGIMAGIIIGKGGSNLKEIKETYGGFVRISGNHEYYPGTDERVVIINGTIDEITETYKYILEKTANTGREPLPNGRGEKNLIVCTNMSAGKLIGKGGSVIKGIKEEFGIKMNIADSVGGTADGERVLTMIGPVEQRIEACRKVIEMIAGEATNMANTNTKYSDAPDNNTGRQYSNNSQYSNNNQYSDNSSNQFGSDYNQGNIFGGGGANASIDNRLLSALGDLLPLNQRNSSPMNSGGPPPQQRAERTAPQVYDCKVQATLEIPDDKVGLLMGKSGSLIKTWWKQSGGAKFRFSNKDEFIEGTQNRSLTITGTMDQVKAAVDLVQNKGEELQQG